MSAIDGAAALPGPLAPPPGPGVQPPFAAPPIDGDRTRVWVGLGVGAGLLALCCIGGVAGLGGLMVTQVEAINEQAGATAKDYLSALVAKDYTKAYAQLCDSQQDRVSPTEFTAQFRSGEVAAYQIYDAELTDHVVVPADVSFQGGGRVRWRLVMTQDRGTGRFEVCGREE